MSNTPPTNIDDLTREDLVRVVQRDRFIKEQLSARIASVMHENVELVAIIQELQQDLGSLREGQATLMSDMASNGEVSPEPAPVES